MINVIKVFDINGIRCELGVDMEDYKFTAYVKETYPLVKDCLKVKGDNANDVMKTLEEVLDSYMNAGCQSWYEFGDLLKTAIEKSPNNNYSMNLLLVREYVIRFVTSYLGGETDKILSDIPIVLPDDNSNDEPKS